MKIKIISFLMIFAVVSFHPSNANVGFYSGPSKNIVNIQSKNLLLKNEKVDFNIVSKQDDNLYVNVKAEFNIRNSSNEKTMALLGFPFIDESSISKFVILQNGIPISIQKKDNIYTWESFFLPSEEIFILISYHQKFTYYGLHGAKYSKNTPKDFKILYHILYGLSVSFDYITSTLKSWKLPVESVSFTFHSVDKFLVLMKAENSDARKDFFDKYNVDAGYSFISFRPSGFERTSSQGEHKLFARNVSHLGNINFSYYFYFAPGKPSEIKAYITKLRLNRKEILLLKSFYEAKNGKPFKGELLQFFKGYDWYKPNKNYNFSSIPQEDQFLIKEFDKYL